MLLRCWAQDLTLGAVLLCGQGECACEAGGCGCATCSCSRARWHVASPSEAILLYCKQEAHMPHEMHAKVPLITGIRRTLRCSAVEVWISSGATLRASLTTAFALGRASSRMSRRQLSAWTCRRQSCARGTKAKCVPASLVVCLLVGSLHSPCQLQLGLCLSPDERQAQRQVIAGRRLQSMPPHNALLP